MGLRREISFFFRVPALPVSLPSRCIAAVRRCHRCCCINERSEWKNSHKTANMRCRRGLETPARKLLFFFWPTAHWEREKKIFETNKQTNRTATGEKKRKCEKRTKQTEIEKYIQILSRFFFVFCFWFGFDGKVVRVCRVCVCVAVGVGVRCFRKVHPKKTKKKKTAEKKRIKDRKSIFLPVANCEIHCRQVYSHLIITSSFIFFYLLALFSPLFFPRFFFAFAGANGQFLD